MVPLRAPTSASEMLVNAQVNPQRRRQLPPDHPLYFHPSLQATQLTHAPSHISLNFGQPSNTHNNTAMTMQGSFQFQAQYPTQNLAAYAASVAPFPLPPRALQTLGRKLRRLSKRKINKGIPIRQSRNGPIPELAVPTRGVRQLAEIERIDAIDIERAAVTWHRARLPSHIVLTRVARDRPDLFICEDDEDEIQELPHPLAQPPPQQPQPDPMAMDYEDELEEGIIPPTSTGDTVQDYLPPYVNFLAQVPSGPAPKFNPELVRFTLPALDFVLRLPAHDVDDEEGEGDWMDEEGGSETETEDELEEMEQVAPKPSGSGSGGFLQVPSANPLALGRQPSGLSSFADLTDALSQVDPIRRTEPSWIRETDDHMPKDDFPLDAPSHSASPSTSTHPSPAFSCISLPNHSSPLKHEDSPTALAAQSRLTKLWREGFLATARSILHMAEPEYTQGWNWMEYEDAVELVSGPQPPSATQAKEKVDVAVWARRPLGEANGKKRMINRRSKNQGFVPFVTAEEEWTKGEVGMACISLAPWNFTAQSFEDFTQNQEFTDGVRGEKFFLSHESVWAFALDICQRLKIHHFVLSTHTHIAYGSFSTSYQTAFITQPVPINFPSFAHIRLSDGQVVVGPNAIQCVMFWMRSSMGTCMEGWGVPDQASGGFASGKRVRGADETEGAGLRECVWKYSRVEGASMKATLDAKVEVAGLFHRQRNMMVAAATRPLVDEDAQTTTDDGELDAHLMGGGGPILYATRTAQIAQRMDVEALKGGKGNELVPQLNHARGGRIQRVFYDKGWGLERHDEDGGGLAVYAMGWGVSKNAKGKGKMREEDMMTMEGEVEGEGAGGALVYDRDGDRNLNLNLQEGEDMERHGQREPTEDVFTGPAVASSSRQRPTITIPNAVRIPSNVPEGPGIYQDPATGFVYHQFGNHLLQCPSDDDEDIQSDGGGDDAFNFDDDEGQDDDVQTAPTTAAGSAMDSANTPKRLYNFRSHVRQSTGETITPGGSKRTMRAMPRRSKGVTFLDEVNVMEMDGAMPTPPPSADRRRSTRRVSAADAVPVGSKRRASDADEEEEDDEIANAGVAETPAKRQRVWTPRTSTTNTPAKPKARVSLPKMPSTAEKSSRRRVVT